KGDYYRITQEMIGRRVNVAVPADSLLLLKATGKVPHTGGRLFDVESPHYRTLYRWIEAGALEDSAAVPEPVEIALAPERMVFNGVKGTEQTKVTARYSDGSTRDVTHLARFLSNNVSTAAIDADGKVSATGRGDTFVFARFNRFTIGSEVIVLPADSTYRWPAPPANNYIDELVYDRLQKLHLLPSELCDDETFLRRVYLDLTGVPPTFAEYEAFTADNSARKRDELVDRLLASDAFTDVWTAKWAESLRVIGGGYAPTATDVKAAEAYFEWIREQIAANRPLNEFVADQITAGGSNLTTGPANLYTMLVHDTKFTPKNFAADFSQLFTGVQIQCAECHNHPFDRWTMDDYYGFVSLFTGIRRKTGAEAREFYIYNDASAPPAKHLIDGRPVPVMVLGGETAVPKGTDTRQALAAWLTSPDNELFSQNLANRIWAHFMGRGLVEPLDDMRISNPPTNKPLLDALAKHLTESKFNLRALVREICTSRVYQLSSRPNETNALDDRQFSRARLRRLRADVLLDSVVQVTESERGFRDFQLGTKAIQFYPRTPGDTTGPHAGDSFFETFGRSSRATVCACETKPDPTLSQALHLIAGDTVHARVAAGGLVPKLIASQPTPEAIIEQLFIRALTRKPTAEELAGMRKLVGTDVKDRKAYEDLFWGLLNSTEFSFNH
ncbi:MAG: DUF1549 and DUF1553 domain-containing protein, partial [Planctomycetia bacterium]|nr:DUF1549 and DUF1553 domain-containing protein [Planctomycetia bacterium]